MREKIKICLIIFGINFLGTSILELMGEYNFFSYVIGLCVMGIANIVIELMGWK